MVCVRAGRKARGLGHAWLGRGWSRHIRGVAGFRLHVPANALPRGGPAVLAASHQAPAALVGVVVPGGLWLTSVSAPRDRLRAGWLTRPLSNLYDAMGEDMQAWCDTRHRAAAEEPQWISGAAQYYYDQVKGRIKDRRALAELRDWRDSIVHKIGIVRLINLDTTPARLHDSLQRHPSTQNLRRRSADELPRLARRMESDAINELDLFLAAVYRLGYHKLLIYPFRPSVHRSPRASSPT
jgi:hypothetical protein